MMTAPASLGAAFRPYELGHHLVSRIEKIVGGADDTRLDQFRLRLARQRASRHSSMSFGRYILSADDAADLFHFCGVAQRIASIFPKEATRKPFVWKDIGPKTKTRLSDMRFQKAICHAASMGRALGGAAILIGSSDRAKSEMPLDEANPGEIRWLEVYDRRDLSVSQEEEDTTSPVYARPLLYRIGDRDFHRSRFVFFGGAPTADRERRENGHWDYSIYQASEETLLDFEKAWHNAGYMLDIAQQTVMKLKNWVKGLGTRSKQASQARMYDIDAYRSIFNTVFLDADNEDMTNLAANFASVPELLDRFAYKLSANFAIPVTILMGQAPAGLNATGQADIDMFQATAESYQHDEIKPPAERVAHLVARGFGEKEPELSFSPLAIETPKSKLDRIKVMADIDNGMVQNEIAQPSTIAKHRLGAGDWDSMPREEVLTITTDTAEPGSPAAQTTDPKITLAPTDLALIVTVDEGRASAGLPPLTNAAHGAMTISAYKAMMASVVAIGAAAEAGKEAPDAPTPTTPPPADPTSTPPAAPAPA